MSERTSPIRPRKRPTRKHGGRRRRPAKQRVSFWKSLLALISWFVLGGVALGAFATGAYMLHLDEQIVQKFEGKKWQLPARVYARPLELYPGAEVSARQFADELSLLRYREAAKPSSPGSYARNGSSFDIATRHFAFWDGNEPSRRLRVAFAERSVSQISALDGQADPSLVRIEPLQIAGIYPSHEEDRILVKREQLPPVLVDTLLAVEDRLYYEHFGINPKGILRAMIANLRAGRTVQGGSTLTQQLIKNYFLSNERTYTRKLNEMLMALLLDWHYDKDEILEAYVNEVYLGQDGSRAIHGLGLASRFYFDRTVAELDLHHIALLVGLIRGPSQYDPRRHPESAKGRRAVVLDIMVDQGLISAEDAATAKAKPLEVSDEAPSGVTRYPAFLDLVQRQLREDYPQQELESEGLRIFTTLDPQVQQVAEQAIQDRLPELEKQAGQPAGKLQAAAIVADSQTGEVQAIVGGREVRLAGFNRALDAQRPAGSSLKPAVYLSALEYPQYYTLATRVDDSTPIRYTTRDGKRWEPKNYDRRGHGMVMLRDALAKSYNIATARLGLELDVIKVLNTLKRLGLERDDIKPYPSLLLGAVDLSPFEVAQIYETFASGGYRIPLRAIREVVAADGDPLERYDLTVQKAIEPGPYYLITKAMQRVVEAGTASAAYATLDRNLELAGKTGTTDDYRDSWFSGFSGNVLTVVWLGRDDNKPTQLSGSKGALPIWIDIMKQLPLKPVYLDHQGTVEYVTIDARSGDLDNGNCENTLSMPFIVGSAPRYYADCGDDPYIFSNDGYQNTGGPNSATSDNSVEDFFRGLQE